MVMALCSNGIGVCGLQLHYVYPSSPPLLSVDNTLKRVVVGMASNSVSPSLGLRRRWRSGVEMAMERGRGKPSLVRAGMADDDDLATEVDVSIFRFTLGIPGFDDGDLPRLVGIIFGSLIIINHTVSLESLTDAQMRSEVLGLFLAAMAISLPFVGLRLKGGEAEKDGGKVAGRSSIFSLADTLTDSQKQELAWGSYGLLRNTRTSAVIVWHNGEVVCARGCWEVGDIGAKALTVLLHSLKSTLFMESRGPLYISSDADTRGWAIVPKDAKSLLVQPFLDSSATSQTGNGGLILVSYQPRSYSSKDRTWVGLLAQKLSQMLNAEVN